MDRPLFWLLTLIALLLFATLPAAYPALTVTGSAVINRNKLADVIYLAEGGAAAKVPYGILTVKVNSAAEARAVCLTTINSALEDFRGGSARQFIYFLADRYCPPRGPGADPLGNAHWKRNVSALYFRSTTTK